MDTPRTKGKPGRPKNLIPPERFNVMLGTEEQAMLAALAQKYSLTPSAVLRLGLRVLSGQGGGDALLLAKAPRFTKEQA